MALLLVGSALHQATRHLEAGNRAMETVAPTVPFTEQIAGLSLGGSQAPVPQPRPLQLEVERGDTLGGLLTGLGLSSPEAREATAELSRFVEPRHLKAGDPVAVFYDLRHRIEGLELVVRGKGRVRLARRDDGWQSAFSPFVRSVETRTLDGEITSSLVAAIEGQDGPPGLAFRMAQVLQWDLDFNRDLRRGDRFQVLFEEVYLDGAYSSVGDIHALVFTNRGHRHEAYRFGNEGGYYDAEGRPLKKMFLRSPLAFSRVTSRFSKRRFHPVLKTYRPHYGVDYGAAVGTPVRVTAHGTVTFAGWDRGGGRTVKVRHPRGYLTAYLHLSRFADGIRPGAKVRQEQVVGYVGATGLATAPHLDYRVKHDGKWIDPLSLGSVATRSLAAGEKEHFDAWRDALTAALAAGGALPPMPAAPELRTATLPAPAVGLGR